MSAPSDLEARTLKAKKAVTQQFPNHAAPMTFFLRTEAEMDKSTQQSDDASMQPSIQHSIQHPTTSFTEDDAAAVTDASSMADTSYGVQSLEDAMHISTDSLSSLARTSSNEGGIVGNNMLAGRKRKPGNPVHPKIFATGQRIVSSEYQPSPSSSPLRTHARRTSLSSSAHLTPLNMSPHPDAVLPGTPRTNSIKSFRLSDEEASVASDTGSQVIQSSSSEDDPELPLSSIVGPSSPEPQLVMPSITMPKRRPFTQRGRSMGQFKIMVAGGCGLGKTSLIRNIFRLCEDIVHVDGITGSVPSQTTSTSKSSLQPTTSISELQASTKPLPIWWSDLENSRTWWRRKSFSDGVLERNLRFLDTPGIDSEVMAQQLLKEVDKLAQQGLHLDNLSDNQLLNLFSGKGEGHIDAVLYLFEPEEKPVSNEELQLLSELSTRTNIIPLIARSDRVDTEALHARQTSLMQAFDTHNIEICSLTTIEASQGLPTLPSSGHDIYAISSLTDDGDIMDASTLMASSYLPPLKPSELKTLVDTLLQPSTMERLRHQSTLKFLAWRRNQISPASPRRALLSPSDKRHVVTSPGNMHGDTSKVLVPYGYSSYFRSTSPSASDASEPIFAQSPYALPQNQQAIEEPSRHTHVARWARDLHRSLRRDGTWRDEKSARPSKGQLGGDLAVIDPKDPLGILSMTQAFGQRGWLALQVVGGCGLLSAAVWWIARNWIEWQSWLLPGQDGYFAPLALPAPTRSWMDSIRGF